MPILNWTPLDLRGLYCRTYRHLRKLSKKQPTINHDELYNLLAGRIKRRYITISELQHLTDEILWTACRMKPAGAHTVPVTYGNDTTRLDVTYSTWILALVVETMYRNMRKCPHCGGLL